MASVVHLVADSNGRHAARSVPLKKASARGLAVEVAKRLRDKRRRPEAKAELRRELKKALTKSR